MFLKGELLCWNKDATIIIQRKVRAYKRSESEGPERVFIKKYFITDRMYNRVIDNEPEVIVKVKSSEFEKKSSKTSAYNFLYFFSFVFF